MTTFMKGQMNEQVMATLDKHVAIPMFEFESDTSVWKTQEKLLDLDGFEPLDTMHELEKEREEEKKNPLKRRSYNALILRTFPPLVRYAGARFGTTKDDRAVRLDAPDYINPLLSNKEWNAQYRWWKRESKKILAKEAKSKKKAEAREEKEINRDYKELGYKKVMKDGKEVKEQKLVDSKDVRLLFDTTQEAREKWANTKMGRTGLTRRDIIMQVGKGDYSNFENLDDTMRNMFAKEALDRMVANYAPEGKSVFDCEPEEICETILKEGGVSALLDAPLRLGLSLAQNENPFYKEDRQKNWFRRLDEQMSAAVMMETLKKKDFSELTNQVSEELIKKRGMNKQDARKAATKMAYEDEAQKIQVAKRLLLMHMGRFTQVKNKDGEQSRWDKPVAVALSHCSRVTLTMPKCSDTKEGKKQYNEMWKSIFYLRNDVGEFNSNLAQDKKRAASTHNIKVRRNSTKEKKVLVNLIGQRGMNVAIGGLGNAGVSGKMLINDGSCGHFYSMYKKGDTDSYGAILMGLESDRPGVMNQLGHTHDAKATAEKASSLGGQRTDEVGMKYGGRQCNLTEINPTMITMYMAMLEKVMKRNLPDKDDFLKLLVGKPSFHQIESYLFLNSN